MFEQKLFFDELKEKYGKGVEAFKHEVSAYRTGKASPALLDGIVVDYYGVPTPLKQASAITAPDARLLMVQPFDKSLLKAIEDAIRNSDLGLNPMNDGIAIKVPIPALNEQRRKELVKQVHQIEEKFKVSLRSVRREAMDQIKIALKDKEITEDDEKKFSDKVQKELNDYVKLVEDLTKKKEKEIMEV